MKAVASNLPWVGKVEVDEALAGKTLAACVRALRPECSWAQARQLCSSGKAWVNGCVSSDSAARVALGDTLELKLQAPRLRVGNRPRAVILFEDRDMLVVNKPAGLITVPVGDNPQDSMLERVRLAVDQRGLKNASLSMVHRLDVDTSGLLVVSRHRDATRALKAQLFDHAIERTYWAIVHGQVENVTFRTHLLENRGDGLRGSFERLRASPTTLPPHAKLAITHVSPLQRLRAAALVECRLETGRQHQIRIHLSEAGAPIVGERVYIKDFRGKPIPAPRQMLHAHALSLRHPRTGEPLAFSAPPPEDFTTVLRHLGG